jgi:RNA polymerase sigma factor (sigma-70 family)
MIRPAPAVLPLFAGMATADSDPPRPGIAELTRRMAAGEDRAFAEFHAAWFARLFRYVLVLQRGDETAAAEVLQDTMIRVARYAKCCEDEEIFWCWLIRLARSAAADHGRRRSRYLRFLDRFRRQLPPPEPAPADEAEELKEHLQAALLTLPEAGRHLLAAKYDDGQSVRELATALGLSEEAIGSRLARARQLLREAVFQRLKQNP